MKKIKNEKIKISLLKYVNFENTKSLSHQDQVVLFKFGFKIRTDEAILLQKEYENKVTLVIPDVEMDHVILDFISIKEQICNLFNEFMKRLNEIEVRFPEIDEYLDDDEHGELFHGHIYPNHYYFDVNFHLIKAEFGCFISKYIYDACGEMMNNYNGTY